MKSPPRSRATCNHWTLCLRGELTALLPPLSTLSSRLPAAAGTEAARFFFRAAFWRVGPRSAICAPRAFRRGGGICFSRRANLGIQADNPASSARRCSGLLRLLVLVLDFVPLRAAREQPVRRGVRRRRGWRHSGRFRAQSQFLQCQRIELARGAQSTRRLIFLQGIGSGSIPL